MPETLEPGAENFFFDADVVLEVWVRESAEDVVRESAGERVAAKRSAVVSCDDTFGDWFRHEGGADREAVR